MLTPKYSGEESKEFWEIINNLPEDASSLMYTFGVSLQNLEGEVIKALLELMQDDLLPCPFCGGEDITITRNSMSDDGNDEHWVECDCGATSQMGVSKVSAIILWNSRYAPNGK